MHAHGIARLAHRRSHQRTNLVEHASTLRAAAAAHGHQTDTVRSRGSHVQPLRAHGPRAHGNLQERAGRTTGSHNGRRNAR